MCVCVFTHLEKTLALRHLPATVARVAQRGSAVLRVNTGAGLGLHLEGNHDTPTFFPFPLSFFFSKREKDQREAVENKNWDFILENEQPGKENNSSSV